MRCTKVGSTAFSSGVPGLVEHLPLMPSSLTNFSSYTSLQAEGERAWEQQASLRAITEETVTLHILAGSLFQDILLENDLNLRSKLS